MARKCPQLLVPPVFPRGSLDDESVYSEELTRFGFPRQAMFVTWWLPDALASESLPEPGSTNGSSAWETDTAPGPCGVRSNHSQSAGAAPRTPPRPLFTTVMCALDQCRGSCVLARPGLMRAITDVILRNDDVDYSVYDLAILPNHIHVLFATDTILPVLQLEAWRRATATFLFQYTGGRFASWSATVLVAPIASEEDFICYRCYLALHGPLFRLNRNEYLHYSRLLPEPYAYLNLA